MSLDIKELLIGKANLPIFIIGHGLSSNFLQKFLNIETKASIELDPESKGKIFASGLYNMGVDFGPFLHVDFISEQKPPNKLILSEINAEVERIMKIGKVKKPKKPEEPYWVHMLVHTPKMIESPYGKYNQSVRIEKKINDNSTKYDFWTVELVNESVSGIVAFESEYVNKENDTKIDVNHDIQAIIDYQPGGNLSEGSAVSINIGIPPSISATWDTGKTTLRNMSDMDQDYCRWIVNYNTTGIEASSTHTWKTGTEIRTREASSLKIKIENNVKWLHNGPTKSFHEIFEYTIEP